MRCLKYIFDLRKKDDKKIMTIFGVRFKIRSRLQRKISEVRKESESRVLALTNEIENQHHLIHQIKNQLDDFQNFTRHQISRMEFNVENIKRFQMDAFLANRKSNLNSFEFKAWIKERLEKSNKIVGLQSSSDLSKFNSFFQYLFKGTLLSYDAIYHTEAIDLVYIWGNKAFDEQMHVLRYAEERKLPIIIMEDGLLRSFDTWVEEGAPPHLRSAMSFMIDDLTAHFDAHRPSRLEMMLNDEALNLSDRDLQRAKNCIETIVFHHLTKYNHQPLDCSDFGRPGIKKILVVDQSYGDMSIEMGLSSEQTFTDMLDAAQREHPDADILVKTHPDAMAGRKGYFDGLVSQGNVYVIREKINPISLLKKVDEVYVCTSQLGFEALMCGKKVHTFGMPFYAGWGVTLDRKRVTRRARTRSLEEIFYIVYILYSYYVNPENGCAIEIEDAMSYLLKQRNELLKIEN